MQGGRHDRHAHRQSSYFTFLRAYHGVFSLHWAWGGILMNREHCVVICGCALNTCSIYRHVIVIDVSCCFCQYCFSRAYVPLAFEYFCWILGNIFRMSMTIEAGTVSVLYWFFFFSSHIRNSSWLLGSYLPWVDISNFLVLTEAIQNLSLHLTQILVYSFSSVNDVCF